MVTKAIVDYLLKLPLGVWTKDFTFITNSGFTLKIKRFAANPTVYDLEVNGEFSIIDDRISGLRDSIKKYYEQEESLFREKQLGALLDCLVSSVDSTKK